jgi:phosphatidate cytidylyltransferase
MKRLLTALIALPILLYAAWSAQPYLFHGLAAAALLTAQWELFGMAQRLTLRPFRWLGLAGTATQIALAATGKMAWSGAALAGTTVAVLVATLARVSERERVLPTAGATLFSVLYVGLLGSYLVAVRAVPTPGMAGQLLTLYFAILMSGDAAAYYVGRAFGRHKLAPRVSPGKTVEGALGGFGGSLVGALVSQATFYQQLPIWHAVVLAVAVGALGQLGDLAESLLKRGAGVKDSSAILPGHGGLLDRLDSLLLPAPVLYYYWLLVV